jgi:hypothetical protein
MVRIDRTSSAPVERRSAVSGTHQRSVNGKSAASPKKAEGAPGLIVRGEVATEQQGPASGATVWLSTQSVGSSDTAQRVLAETTTDERGRFELRCGEIPDEAVVSGQKSGFAAGAAVIQPPAASRGNRPPCIVEANLLLRNAAVLRGKVTDKAGKGLRGASVSASHSSEPFLPTPGKPAVQSVQTWSSMTDSEGAFILRDIPAATLSLDVALENHVPQQRKVTAPAENLVFTLDSRGADVAGYVVPLGGGAGISSATVRLSLQVAADAVGNKTRAWTAVTDDMGAFAFSALPDGRYSVSAAKDHLRLAPRDALQGNQIDVSVARPVTDLRLHLYPGHTISGKVKEDGRNRPLEGVEITALCDPPRTVTTGADGTYQLSGIGADAAGNYVPVRLRKPGYASRELSLQDGDMVDVVKLDPVQVDVTRDYALTKLLSVSGRVLTEQGVGIAAATVGFMRSPQKVETDADGRYELPTQSRDDLMIQASAAGYGQGILGPLYVEDDDTTSGNDIVLRPEAVIEGLVVNEKGQPMNDARIEIIHLENETAIGGLPVTTVKSGSDGTFSIPGMPGRVIFGLVAYKDTYVRSAMERISPKAGESLRDVRLVLRTPRFLAGTVIGVDGKPAPNVTVLVRNDKPIPEGFGMDVTHEDGRFRIENIGSDRVSLTIPDPKNEPEFLKDVETNRDDVRIVRTAKTPVAFVGRVIDARTNDPVGAFEVSSQLEKMEIVKEGPGLFSVRGLVRGSLYQFNIQAPGFVPLKTTFARVPQRREVVEETYALQRASPAP